MIVSRRSYLLGRPSGSIMRAAGAASTRSARQIAESKFAKLLKDTGAENINVGSVGGSR